MWTINKPNNRKPNDINVYCQYAACQVNYNKLKTAGNDPQISQKMKYAQYVRTAKPCVARNPS